MKPLSLSVMLCVLFVVFVQAEEAAPLASAPENLLANSDFSQVGADGKPADWGINGTTTTLEKEDGANFLRLTVKEPNKDVMVYRRLYLKNPKPAALEIRLRVRYSDIQHGAQNWNDGRLIAKFKNAQDKEVSATMKNSLGDDAKVAPPIPTFNGSSAWQEINFFAPVPPDAQYLELMPFLMQAKSGTLDFAKIEVLPASLDQVPAPQADNPNKYNKLVPSETVAFAAPLPPALKVVGNKIIADDGKEIWWQGVCVDSMQWSQGEKILTSIPVAVEQWKANVIRLPLTDEFWAGRNKWQKDAGAAYRKTVDDAIAYCASKGVYLIIDLHRFHAPTATHVEFWRDVATRYKNNPTVIFELFNEPHDISWKLWRDGGSLSGKENNANDQGAKENSEKADKDYCVGMQALINAIREVGADNPVIVGGLDWSYDLRGIISGEYELQDPNGRGIIYTSHVYPWKSGWQKNFVDILDKHPLLIGEFGNLRKWEEYSFIPENSRKEVVGENSPWPRDILGLIQANKIHYTGFSFHPKAGPQLLEDWDYTPTKFWGVFLKDALAGKQFTMEKMR